MRRLILLRHAKTEHSAPSGRDVDRRLDKRGTQDAHDVGQWLARNSFTPDLAWVSTAHRAQQTWDILAKSFTTTRVEHRDELYSADAGDLLTMIHAAGIADPKVLMIVAHNPSMHELGLALIAAGEMAGRQALAANLPTTGVIVIDFTVEDWSDVGFRKGSLERFVSPKLLKEWSDHT